MENHTKQMTALLPCPFCGGDARLDDYTTPEWGKHDKGASANCLKCFNYYYGYTPSDALEKWNTRANRFANFTDEELIALDVFDISDCGEGRSVYKEIAAEKKRRKK